jgi:hypothetical protein
MKKFLTLLAAIAALVLIVGCSDTKESKTEPEASGEETREEARLERTKSIASVLPKISLANSQQSSYWYECDYYGSCWDSEGYSWNDCYYNSYDDSCDSGNYWFINTPAEEIAELDPITYNYSCCDSWGGCYDDLGEWYSDPIYSKANYCDECGNCYDYYGNYVKYDANLVDEFWCSQYYQYENVETWDSCGNAYDLSGEFMFYDNLYYNFETCNEDYSTCEIEAFGGPDPLAEHECNTSGDCYDQNGDWYSDPTWMVADYCDECGNCYDYYGNYVNNDANLVDDYWCSQYYQYENVETWDSCGNSYNSNGEFLFYDNAYYDYVQCYEQ